MVARVMLVVHVCTRHFYRDSSGLSVPEFRYNISGKTLTDFNADFGIGKTRWKVVQAGEPPLCVANTPTDANMYREACLRASWPCAWLLLPAHGARTG